MKQEDLEESENDQISSIKKIVTYFVVSRETCWIAPFESSAPAFLRDRYLLPYEEIFFRKAIIDTHEAVKTDVRFVVHPIYRRNLVIAQPFSLGDEPKIIDVFSKKYGGV